MYRLTTPTHTFTVNIDPSEWDQFKITYKQDTVIVFEKTEADLSDITISEVEDGKWSISYALKVEETQLFKPYYPVKIQIRCHYPNGDSFASSIMQTSVEEILNKELFNE